MKKFILIPILTLALLTGSLFIESQKQETEAVIPLAVWVAINVIPALVVGAVMWFKDDNGEDSPKKISALNAGTGEVTLEDMSDSVWWNAGTFSEFKTWTNASGTKLYPVTDAMVAALEAGGVQWSWSWIRVSNIVGGLTQGVVNNIIGGGYCFLVYRCKTDVAGWSDKFESRRVDLPCPPNPDFMEALGLTDWTIEPISGGLGDKYSGNIAFDNDGNPLDIDGEFYEFEEDIPLLPDCFDGIQNQDETGIDCGGVCLQNFGFNCPPAETCFDGIMNQDETGIDFGGVCGTGNPVAQPPGNFTDDNVDGVDDISGLDSGGNVPVAVPGAGNATTYDASLPGDVSEVGETDWTGLITGYLASNPLVLLATGSQINVTGATCSLPMTLFGKSMTIDFCSLDWMVDLFGTFVLGLMAIRAVFIAMGI